MQKIKWLSERVYPQEENIIKENKSRSSFYKDYGSVIYRSQFRRLAHKTQMFTKTGKDFPRTRLTHSIEVSQIGRELARIISSKINLPSKTSIQFEDLVATSGLSHDIGHPPFGHAGAGVLSRLSGKLSNNEYVFDDNKQVVRLLLGCSFSDQSNNQVYIRNPFYVTSALVESVMKYKNSEYREGKDAASYESESEICLKISEENGTTDLKHPACYLMEIADDISYMASDVADCLYLNIVTESELVEMLESIDIKIDNSSARDDKFFRNFSNKIIGKCLDHVKVGFNELFVSENNDPQEIPRYFYNFLKDKGKTKEKFNFLFWGEYGAKLKKFKDELYSLLLDNPYTGQIDFISKKVITTLWDNFNGMLNAKDFKKHAFYKLMEIHVRCKIGKYMELVSRNEVSDSQLISDYISSMSDNYAIELFNKITDTTKL